MCGEFSFLSRQCFFLPVFTLLPPDCCDGSDEYSGLVSCPNTCQELGSAHQEEELKARRWQEQGWAAKVAYMKEGCAVIKEAQELADKMRAEQESAGEKAREASSLIKSLEEELAALPTGDESELSPLVVVHFFFNVLFVSRCSCAAKPLFAATKLSEVSS